MKQIHCTDLNNASDRVRDALDGKLLVSDLEENEQIIFYDLLAQRHATDKAVFAAELRQQAGNVGYDEEGNLLKTLGGGAAQIIEPSAARDSKTHNVDE